MREREREREREVFTRCPALLRDMVPGVVVQVVEAHLEGPDFQQGVGALRRGPPSALHQPHHRRLRAARQELGPGDGHLAQVVHLDGGEDDNTDKQARERRGLQENDVKEHGRWSPAK